MLRAEGVPTDENIKVLVAHLRTRQGHNQLHAVLSVAVFCNFKNVDLVDSATEPRFKLPVFVQRIRIVLD